MSAIVEINRCVICGSSKAKIVFARPIAEFIGKRSYYDLGSFGLTGSELLGYTRCLDCSFVFASPTLDEAYEQATYNDAKRGQLESMKAWLSDPDVAHLYDTNQKWSHTTPFLLGLGFHFERFKKPNNTGQRQIRMLDIGCGFGHTLELGRAYGIDAVGCDIDQNRLDACRAKGFVAVRPEEVSGEFDIVLSNNVIEHVYDLHGYIKTVSHHLAPGGVFVVSGVEASVIGIELKRRRFKLLHPIEHRSILTRRTLGRLLNTHGLRLASRGEIFRTMKRVRSKAALYLPYLVRDGFLPVNGAFSAIAVRA